MNQETAILLAKRGYRIRLLPVDSTPGQRNPDVLFVRESIQVEFKHNLTPTSSAIDNEIRDAKNQADYVVLHVRSRITRGHLLKAVKSRIYTARNIREIWIIWQGEVYYFLRKEILDGAIDRKIQ